MENAKQNNYLILWLALLALLYAASPLLGDARLWGINQLRFVSSTAKIVFIALLLLAFVPGISSKINRGLNSIQDSYLNLKPVPKIGVSIAIFIGAYILFYFFKSATYLLGDGFLRIDELGYGFGYLPLSTEPLTSILHYGFFKILGPLTGMGKAQSIQIFSCLTGAAFVLVILNLIKPEKDIPFSPLLLVLGMGGTQFYFGYVESYGLLYMGLLVYLWLSYKYLATGKSFGAACIVYMVTFYAHFSILFTFPAYLFLLYPGIRDKRLEVSQKLMGILSLALMAVGFIYFRYIFTPSFGEIKVSFLLPFTPGGYWIFSPRHLVDIANSLLLSAMSLVLLLPLIIKEKLWKRFSTTGIIFSALLFIGSMGYLFAIDPKLGFGRDWDLFVPAGMVLVVIGYFLIAKGKSNILKYRGYLQTAVLIPIVLTTSFIAINASLHPSYKRFEYILSLHKERSAFGYESLAGQLKRDNPTRENLRQALVYYRKAFDLLKNPRYLTDIASVYDVFYNSYKDESVKKVFIDSIEYYSKEALALNDSVSQAYEYLASASIYRKNYARALGYMDIVLKFIPPDREAEFRNKRVSVLMAMQDLDRAAIECEKIISIDPDFAEAYQTLGYIYLKKNDTANAYKYLSEYLKRDPNSEHRATIEKVLDQLKTKRNR